MVAQKEQSQHNYAGECQFKSEYLCVHVCECVCVHLCVCVCACVCPCVCVNVHRMRHSNSYLILSVV